MTTAIVERARELTAKRVPFVQATVVRAQVPASARAGDEAIILPDGSIVGFVGGQCAENSVRTAALGSLADGRTLLLRVLPEGEAEFPETPGAQVVVNPCLSGGALEIFLQPVLPPPLIEVVGQTPVADAVIAQSKLLGYATAQVDQGPLSPGAAAVIVASHGRGEREAIRAALDAGVGQIALVASGRRGRAILDELGLDDEERSRVKTPAGLWIGARTAPEVALSILAEVISNLRLRSSEAQDEAEAPPPAVVDAPPTTGTDPVCGMSVTIMPNTPHLHPEGADVWFCSDHCRNTYAANAPA